MGVGGFVNNLVSRKGGRAVTVPVHWLYNVYDRFVDVSNHVAASGPASSVSNARFVAVTTTDASTVCMGERGFVVTRART